jgi:hypothetical protein
MRQIVNLRNSTLSALPAVAAANANAGIAFTLSGSGNDPELHFELFGSFG